LETAGNDSRGMEDAGETANTGKDPRNGEFIATNEVMRVERSAKYKKLLSNFMQQNVLQGSITWK
jgi:hypothetical protein